jgi:hypothetical protein
MDGEKYIQQLLLELSIIGQIKGGHRVFSANGTISVSPPARTDFLSRWWNQERRERNLEAIERTLCTVYTVMETLLTKIECAAKLTSDKSTFQERIELKSASQRLKRFCDALQVSKGGNGQGISELLVTYDGDITITSRIKQIIANIDDKLEQVNSVIGEPNVIEWSEFEGPPKESTPHLCQNAINPKAGPAAPTGFQNGTTPEGSQCSVCKNDLVSSHTQEHSATCSQQRDSQNQKHDS